MKGQESSQIYNSNFNKYVRENAGPDGFVMPSNTTSDITDLSAEKPNGTIWYDADNHRLLTKENDVVVQIPTAPI
jgi:hypothetical protein